jgi:hypothetical protein
MRGHVPRYSVPSHAPLLVKAVPCTFTKHSLSHMKKIKLNLEDLQVQSFDPTPYGGFGARGTVHGRGDSVMATCSCADVNTCAQGCTDGEDCGTTGGSGATCDSTCPETCAQTCATCGISCADTCFCTHDCPTSDLATCGPCYQGTNACL